MSSNSKRKVKKILEELSIELTGTSSIPKLAKYLGYTKQNLYRWVKNEEIPLESIISKVDGINPRFITGESNQIWKNGNEVNENISHYSIDALLKEERSRLDTEDIPDTELGRSLQGVLDDAVSLALKIRRLIDLEKRNQDSS